MRALLTFKLHVCHKIHKFKYKYTFSAVRNVTKSLHYGFRFCTEPYLPFNASNRASYVVGNMVEQLSLVTVAISFMSGFSEYIEPFVVYRGFLVVCYVTRG